jgi:hypothetical protein
MGGAGTYGADIPKARIYSALPLVPGPG